MACATDMLSSGKSIVTQLDSRWRDILSANELSDEIAYRLQKLIARLDTVVDKIFISTIKAHEILAECLKLTERFKSELKKQDRALLLLTCLENYIDDLVKKTHDFRIKAG